MKEKIFKILHVIGYISMALLTLIFVVVGVNSCSNTEPQQSIEKHTTNKVVETTSKDKLYLWKEEVGNYKFNQYNTSSLSYQALSEVLNMFAESFSFPGESYSQHAYIIEIRGYNNGLATLLNSDSAINSIVINYATAIVRGYIGDNVLVWEMDLSSDNYQYYDIYVSFRVGDFYSTKEFFKYFNIGYWRYLNNDWKGSFEYIIPPYMTYSIEQDNFDIYFGFSYQGSSYYGVSFNNGQFSFLGVDSNLIFNKKYSLDGKQYVFYVGDTTLEQHKITLTSFGTLGHEWLESNFINQDEPLYNGTFYLNVNEILKLIRTEELPSIYNINYSINFYSGGNFYTNILLDIWHFDNNSNEVLVRLAYSNNGVREEVIIYRYYDLTTLDWITRETDIYKETLFSITLDNTIINSNNYPLLRTYYYVEYIKFDSDSGGSYIGNVFVLIGDSFSSILPILGITIFPGLTIGVLIFIPLVISLVLFVVWLFKR